MRTFSKIVFICNVAFIIAAVLRVVQFTSKSTNNNIAVPTNPFVGTVVILTAISFFINIFFAIILGGLKISKKQTDLSTFIVIFNLIMVPFQFWYYFYSKI